MKKLTVIAGIVTGAIALLTSYNLGVLNEAKRNEKNWHAFHNDIQKIYEEAKEKFAKDSEE